MSKSSPWIRTCVKPTTAAGKRTTAGRSVGAEEAAAIAAEITPERQEDVIIWKASSPGL